MKTYSAYCRLILCCNSSSRVIEAIRSRCLNVQINAPSEEQIVRALGFIGKKEDLQLPSGFAARIAEKSYRNLQSQILCYNSYPHSHPSPYPISESRPSNLPSPNPQWKSVGFRLQGLDPLGVPPCLHPGLGFWSCDQARNLATIAAARNVAMKSGDGTTSIMRRRTKEEPDRQSRGRTLTSRGASPGS
ncbi:hypothetical protein K1719_025681 [Acacia pycnantha]|nr:hypothetical protein K1719_025681 [Acacia pycnantha]